MHEMNAQLGPCRMHGFGKGFETGNMAVVVERIHAHPNGPVFGNRSHAGGNQSRSALGDSFIKGYEPVGKRVVLVAETGPHGSQRNSVFQFHGANVQWVEDIREVVLHSGIPLIFINA